MSAIPPDRTLRGFTTNVTVAFVTEAQKMGMPLSAPFFGYSGAQALDPKSIGVV